MRIQLPVQTLIKFLLIAIGCLGIVGCPSIGGGGGSSVTSGVVAQSQPEAVEPPTQLACTTNMFDAFISWRNRGEYSEIRINRDGSLLVTLAGEAESFSETLSSEGAHIYKIFAFDQAGHPLNQISCQVEARQIASVQSINGSFIPHDNKVNLGWSLPSGSSFNNIRVYRGETFLGEISGGATSFEDVNPPAGNYSYMVRSVVGSEISGPAVCNIAVPELGQISSLSCETDRDSGNIILSWQDGESYDSIQVFCGGEQVDQLSGSETTYSFAFENYGVFTFQVQGTFGERQTDLTTVQGSVGRLVWDPDSQGVVTGYHVYVWAEGDSTPEASNYVYSVGPVTTLTLLELFENGALPEAADPVDLKIALSAFDSEGNISDLSDAISFTWEVRSLNGLN